MSQNERRGFYIDIKGVEVFIESFASAVSSKYKVLCLPGIGNYGWYFEPLAKYLSEDSIAVYAVDYKGTGLSKGVRWDIASKMDWIQDVVTTLEHLPAPGIPTFLLGHSLGGALALHVALQAQRLLRGLVVVAPAMTVSPDPFPWINYFLFPLGMLSGRQHPLLKIPFPSFEEMVRKHTDEELASRLLKDPYRLRRLSIRGALTINQIRKMTNAEVAARSTNLPTLVLCGEEDSALDGAVRYFKHVASTEKQLITFPSQHHHLLRANQNVEVYRAIESWFEKHAQGKEAKNAERG